MFRRSVQTNPFKLERKREKELGKTNRERLRWRTLKMRKEEREKSGKETCVQTSVRWKRKIFCAKRNPNGTWIKAPRNRRKREISPSLLALCSSLFALPSAGHVTRYRFFEENRKEEGTLFDHRSGRWPGFDDTFSLFLSLSLLLAKFENRWILVSRVFQSSSLPIWRSKSLLESNDILSRASSGPCRSLSTRTVRRFSGRAVESYIYIRLYSNFDRCNVFWR